MPKGRESGVVGGDDQPAGGDGERAPGESGPQTLGEALEVRRNVRIGAAAGVGLATLLYVPTFLAFDATLAGSGGYYLGLALVLAVTVAGVVTAGLCGKTMLEPVLDRRAWLHRGGTAAVLGGLAWALVPALAWLDAAGSLPYRYRVAATSLAALALVVGTAGLHVAVRDAAGRIERLAYWLVALGLLLAAGNATGNPGPTTELAGTTLPSPFLSSAFLACAAAVAFAATAELSGVLPALRTRALQAGALCSTLGVAAVFAAGGWPWLVASVADPAPVALAIATVPAGLGWAIAGQGLRSHASQPAVG